MNKSSTIIGKVKHVLGSTVTVSLDSNLAGVTPIWEGRLQPVGQVGSLVRIPQGPVELIGAVSLIGIAELTGPLTPSLSVEIGDRWLQIELLGEVDALGYFRRGVSKFPGLDDPVHFATSKELQAAYPSIGTSRVRIGRLSSAPDVPVTLDAGLLVTRHGAIVGSTGSGKTSAVATILQSFARGGWTSANIVVVDPHGEYSAALGDLATIKSVLKKKEKFLRVPFWALPAKDILRAFCGPVESMTIISKFNELVTKQRREYAKESKWLSCDLSSITADTPIPFNLKKVWYELTFENTATYSDSKGSGDPCVEDEGDETSLKPPKFTAYALGGKSPFKGPTYGYYQTIPDRLRLAILDNRFKFFLEPSGNEGDSDPLPQVICDWLGHSKPVSVLDFSGVPAELTDLAIGVILQLLFEVALRCKNQGIGRPRPVLLILEEAHRYLSDTATTKLASIAANRIAREGRKYGIGLILVTQRPSELPSTALSQCGTIISLRLTNATDQGNIKSSLPDSVSGFVNLLSSLRTGEAIVSGESIILPSRVLIDKPHPEPRASDPTLESWRLSEKKNNLNDAVAIWRGERLEE